MKLRISLIFKCKVFYILEPLAYFPFLLYSMFYCKELNFLKSYLVYIYVAGLLVVVGGVVNDETDRVWSEALLLLHVAVAISN